MRSETLCEFRGRFHTCVADQAHAEPRTLVMSDVSVGPANDLIPRTAEDLDESSVCFALRKFHRQGVLLPEATHLWIIV